MKYKCDVENCSFETEDLDKFISHFNVSHKGILTNYVINWMKSNGETPIETCKCCGKKIEVNELNNNPLSPVMKLRLGSCSNECYYRNLNSVLWRYEPWQGTHLQCLYERCDSWEGKRKGYQTDETKDKIRASVKRAIKEGRLLEANQYMRLADRPLGDKTNWIKYMKSKFIYSKNNLNFINKIHEITRNVKRCLYINLGKNYTFMNYLFIYKMHKINIEIDKDRKHNVKTDLERDKLLYDKYNILTLRINDEASVKLTNLQLLNSINKLINEGPYWKFCTKIEDIYDWKWLVHYGYYKSCKSVLTSG